MNADIEKAIELIESYAPGRDMPWAPVRDALGVVLNALRAQQAKSEGCEYCNKAVPLATGETNDIGIAIQYPNKLVAYGYDVHGFGRNGLSARINFCPHCGKPLAAKEGVC